MGNFTNVMKKILINMQFLSKMLNSIWYPNCTLIFFIVFWLQFMMPDI